MDRQGVFRPVCLGGTVCAPSVSGVGVGALYRPASWQLVQLWRPNWLFILWSKSQLSHAAAAAGITHQAHLVFAYP